MCIFIDFWKIEIKNSILHVFNFFHKLSFDNSFCFLSILSCQTSFLNLKSRKLFLKTENKKKNSYQTYPNYLNQFFKMWVFFFFFLLDIFKKEMSNNFMLIKLTFCQIFNQFYKI